jgi:predicted DNA-binding WGR domain protein
LIGVQQTLTETGHQTLDTAVQYIDYTANDQWAGKISFWQKGRNLVWDSATTTLFFFVTICGSTKEMSKNHTYLECQKGGNTEFIEITLEKTSVVTEEGKVGSETKSTITRDYGSNPAAKRFFEKMVAERLKKGFNRVNRPVAKSVKQTTSSSSKVGIDEGDESDVTVEVDTCTDSEKEGGGDDEKNEEEDEEEEEEEVDENHVYLECVEGNSSKFYEMTLEGTEVSTAYGKIGSAGVKATKDYGTEAAAKKFFDKTLEEKIKKGYSIAKQGKGNDSDDDEDETEEEEEEVKPKKAPPAKKQTATAAKKKQKKESEDEEDDDDEEGDKGSFTGNEAYLECSEGSSFKFYELKLDGTSVTTIYGRIGTSGSAATKDYGSTKAAKDFFNKTLNEKLRKGYHHAKTRTEVESLRPPHAAPIRATKVPASGSPQKTTTTTTSSSSSSSKPKSCYLVCQEGTSNKFYEMILTQVDNSLYTRYGRIGDTGFESRKNHDSYAEAEAAYDKLLKEKLKKGYHHSKADEQAGKESGQAEMKEDEDEEEESKPVGRGTKRKPAPPKKGKEEVEDDEEEEEEPPKKKAAPAKTTKAAAKPAPAAKKETSSSGGLSAYLECVEGNSSKFYEITVSGKTVTSKYGRIGTSGQTTEKSFDTADKAILFYEKTRAEKLLKGYNEA